MAIMTLGLLFLKPYQVAKKIEVRIELTDETLTFEYRINRERKPNRACVKWKDVVGAEIEDAGLKLYCKGPGTLFIPAEVWQQPALTQRLASIAAVMHVFQSSDSPVLDA